MGANENDEGQEAAEASFEASAREAREERETEYAQLAGNCTGGRLHELSVLFARFVRRFCIQHIVDRRDLLFVLHEQLSYMRHNPKRIQNALDDDRSANVVANITNYGLQIAAKDAAANMAADLQMTYGHDAAMRAIERVADSVAFLPPSLRALGPQSVVEPSAYAATSPTPEDGASAHDPRVLRASGTTDDGAKINPYRDVDLMVPCVGPITCAQARELVIANVEAKARGNERAVYIEWMCPECLVTHHHGDQTLRGASSRLGKAN